LGYEIGNGIRDISGRLVNKTEIPVENMKVANLGLSPKTARAYASLPAIQDISAPYKDEHGRPIYGKNGETLYKPTNTTPE
jgi:hypothetical protein